MEIEKARFELGRMVITRGALGELVAGDIMGALARHARSDWGDVSSEDRQENETALQYGERLFSIYHDSLGTKFYVITEWDRSATTVLLPEEY